KVKVMRGQFTKKEGKVERIELKRLRVYITGIEIIKKDGNKLLFPLNPAKLMITELDLSDKLRKEKLEQNNNTQNKSGNQLKNKSENKSEHKSVSEKNTAKKTNITNTTKTNTNIK
ncbi:50S ribosomal protein L24, partial [Candidatus Woesearchaeota archaeon]|nr:50S ribosomal protein L24 [Candidatus Woesearchaeota archaeon]